ncbi:hypothetical protein E4L96_04065 [Massilia arenosa]|uniref:DUF2007 domain-containing protein n=1 Tax=Zemynaea arenosa TaxID=2561931 RepID=A0A4Y9SKC4_9BURK|nr:DUF2007 domain-containing protein [Massilia arenosa]TFW26561.1 hypothetical protein E4L96_04065 [Massilia arenosa]
MKHPSSTLTADDLPGTPSGADAVAGRPAGVLLPGRDLLIVARYFTPTEAHVVCGCLVAAGIPAVVADDNLVQANSLWTPALGGVRVLVPSEHMAEAQAVIAAYERGEFSLRDDEDVGPAAP